MAITADQIEQVLAQAHPQTAYQLNGLSLLSERANSELDAWGHAGHEVTLEPVIPLYCDPRVLRWAFWCEACHVSQLALLSQAEPG